MRAGHYQQAIHGPVELAGKVNEMGAMETDSSFGKLVGLIIAGPAEPLIAIQALLSKFLMCSRHRWTRTDALA